MYRVQFAQEAERDLQRLDPQVRMRILTRLDWLSEHAEQVQHRPLTGPLAGLFKLRLGDFRILYDVFNNDRIIFVHAIGHRRDIYR